MAKRKIGRGKALEELVKGSLDYTIEQINRAFRAQFPSQDDWYAWIVEVFLEYVIVRDRSLAIDEYFRVAYERDGTGYRFAPRDQWEIVELTYQPQTVAETVAPGGTLTPGHPPSPPSPLPEKARGEAYGEERRFVERIEGAIRLDEAVAGKPRSVSGVGITADVVNANSRRYPTVVLREAVQRVKTHLHESAGQGRLAVVGEAEHPSDKGQRPQFLETIVKWNEVEFNESTRQVDIRGQVLETSQGRDAIAIMEGGVMPGISIRGYGHSRLVSERGRDIEEVTELTLTGFDLVAMGEASDPVAGITMLERKSEREELLAMDPNELLEMLRANGILANLAEAVQRMLAEAAREQNQERQMRMLREALGAGENDDLVEAARRMVEQNRRPAGGGTEQSLRQTLGLGETDDLQEALRKQREELARLRDAEQARQVSQYVEAQTASLQYPDWLRAQLVEAIRAVGPKTIDEAKAAIVAKRKEYDAIMAELELRARGYGGIQVLGPVIERETGAPAFARGAVMLTESMVRTGQVVPRKWNRDPAEMSINERFARMYLERFDEVYKQHLMAEARRIEEAEQTSDLNLPYSVARTVIAEALPALVAASIFDMGMTDQSPTRIYYEAYSNETGVENTVSAESVVLTALATYYDLDYKRVQPGTVTVTNSGATVTYVEGTDYVIDYGDGQIQGLSGGGITAGDTVKVTYTYDAVRLGEMGVIQRGKQSLSYKTLEIAADRLADQISSEAVEFARSQLGWDATGRTLVGLVNKISQLIDKHLLWMGLSAALSVASNSGGTWSATPSGGDTYQQNLDKLFRYVGVAKVKVANRFYEPNFILASLTNADVMSNSEQFTQAGKRPDADLNAAGYVGRVKALPVFASTQFSDSYILVGNRELVMHRVFRPMQIKGPYPSYDATTVKIVAADQYYVEEFNGTDAPVPGKGASVKITA